LKINVNESEIAGAAILILQEILSMPVALFAGKPMQETIDMTDSNRLESSKF
jgi:hypothetical protein